MEYSDVVKQFPNASDFVRRKFAEAMQAEQLNEEKQQEDIPSPQQLEQDGGSANPQPEPAEVANESSPGLFQDGQTPPVPYEVSGMGAEPPASSDGLFQDTPQPQPQDTPVVAAVADANAVPSMDDLFEDAPQPAAISADPAQPVNDPAPSADDLFMDTKPAEGTQQTEIINIPTQEMNEDSVSQSDPFWDESAVEDATNTECPYCGSNNLFNNECMTCGTALPANQNDEKAVNE